MAALDQNNNNNAKKIMTRARKPSNGGGKDFSKVGGLINNLKVLRETIIFPLLHSNVFTHFNIKAPRGILFYGPPGTGKTLVAGALATEINKQGLGKVNFYLRKGADVLDKWVGGSEKNLRDLFEKATKNRPAIIFFDEIDGLAPAREKQTDQVHASIVATLLALMDGLDNKPGLVVIGATNRLESVDPALRRPGRFDKELYFPLPGFEARKEILHVHTNSWKHKPSPEFQSELVKLTAGFSGADLQALCTEAVLGCMKRSYTNLSCVKIEPIKLKVGPCDFLQARQNLVPSTVRQGQEMRSLSPVVRPLLEKQLMKIIRSIQVLWPHFLQEDFKYVTGKERYAGRVILVGTNNQGLNNHLVPAILQNLEHLPSYVYDNSKALQTKTASTILNNQPSVILLLRVDEWWNSLEDSEKQCIVSVLEKVHAGLPVLSIATCRADVPTLLQDFFFKNSSIRIKIHNPTIDERKSFFKPLFYDEYNLSLYTILVGPKKGQLKNNAGTVLTRSKRGAKAKLKSEGNVLNQDISKTGKRKRGISKSDYMSRKKAKPADVSDQDSLKGSSSMLSFYSVHKSIKKEKDDVDAKTSDSFMTRNSSDEPNDCFAGILSSLISQDGASKCDFREQILETIKKEPDEFKIPGDGDEEIGRCSEKDVNLQQIDNLWRHTSMITSKNMAVSELELLYDVISACININCSCWDTLVKNLDDTLRNIENSYQGFN